MALLKVQVGALSKVLHCSSNTKFSSLRQSVDSLIRTVAGLDENAEQAMTKMESAFEDVVIAYEKLSSLLDYRQPSTVDEGTNPVNLLLLTDCFRNQCRMMNAQTPNCSTTFKI